MFSSRSSRDLGAERKSNNPKDSEPITLNLNGNKLVFLENQWIVQSEDLERAASEIDIIIEERDELASSLHEASLHTEALNKEIIETNDTKNVALGMVGTIPFLFLYVDDDASIPFNTYFISNIDCSLAFTRIVDGRTTEKSRSGEDSLGISG